MSRAVVVCTVLLALSSRAVADPLPGTQPLTTEGDVASEMVAGIDRFLLREIGRAAENRKHREAGSRQALARVLGIDLHDPRMRFESPELVGTVASPAMFARGDGFRVFAVRWPVRRLPGSEAPKKSYSEGTASLHGFGLLLVPDGEIRADVVAIPHCDHTPEAFTGLEDDLPPEAQFARHLAENHCRVLVPTLVSRETSKRNNRANLTNREYLYRSSFVLGRHLVGYEVEQVLAAVDWFSTDGQPRPVGERRQIGVVGSGEGGRVALYAAALDDRIDVAFVSGAFGSRERTWQEPVDRNVFGLLENFGDAEVAAMVCTAGRHLILDDAELPTQTFAGEGGAPAVLGTPDSAPERARLADILRKRPEASGQVEFRPVDGKSGPASQGIVRFAWRVTGQSPSVRPSERKPLRFSRPVLPSERQQRLVAEIDRHNQAVLAESPYVRAEFMKNLDTSSPEAFAKTVEPYRQIFREQVIGEFDRELLPPAARTRQSWETEHWTGYEVVLDVFPDVIAYGVLLLPKGIEEGERRPVVVCQHGLEGRPTDTFLGDHPAYHDFAAKLAERGFVVFAPQNPYLFGDRFRTLQRKANLVGCTLFSVMVPQHQQICDWLKTLPQVDGERIGFYGLSYGGKSAMRIPALVPDYALSICSADFNDWVWKCASTRSPYSYVWTGEYEIFEFDLGSTFNYAEMATLIAPRPFMVERGHFDGVAPDERVAAEFAKVRHLYAAKLGIGDKCRIEWFAGPHTIHGQGTFDFLHEHLRRPKPDDAR